MDNEKWTIDLALHFLLQVHRRRSVHSMQPHKLQIWLVAVSILGLELGLSQSNNKGIASSSWIDALVRFEL